MAGRFITFEGIEGSGKSTQIARLAERLRRGKIDVVETREPGGTELGRALRPLLLRPTAEPMGPAAELLLYVADRAQHLEKVVEPALKRGELVLCDRYVDTTLAYQGRGRGLDIEWIRALHARAPLDRVPDRTVLLDLDPTLALDRARRRDLDRGRTESEGRFEQERIEFHLRVREGYLALASAAPDRIRVIDAEGPAEEIEQRVVDALADLLPVREST